MPKWILWTVFSLSFVPSLSGAINFSDVKRAYTPEAYFPVSEIANLALSYTPWRSTSSAPRYLTGEVYRLDLFYAVPNTDHKMGGSLFHGYADPKIKPSEASIDLTDGTVTVKGYDGQRAVLARLTPDQVASLKEPSRNGEGDYREFLHVPFQEGTTVEVGDAGTIAYEILGSIRYEELYEYKIRDANGGSTRLEADGPPTAKKQGTPFIPFAYRSGLKYYRIEEVPSRK